MNSQVKCLTFQRQHDLLILQFVKNGKLKNFWTIRTIGQSYISRRINLLLEHIALSLLENRALGHQGPIENYVPQSNFVDCMPSRESFVYSNYWCGSTRELKSVCISLSLHNHSLFLPLFFFTTISFVYLSSYLFIF